MKPRARAAALSALACVGLLLAACSSSSGGGAAATTSATTGKSASASSSASTTASPAASAATSVSASASLSVSAPPPSPKSAASRFGHFVAVKGYTYVPVPSELSPLVSALKKSGLTDTVKARGAVMGGHTGEPDVAIIVSTYKPELAAQLDALPLKTVLDNAVKGAQAASGTTDKATDYPASGTHIRVISTRDVAVAVIYQKGGVLIEIYGDPKSRQHLAFARAYLAAGG
jgi:hypothetical protein